MEAQKIKKISVSRRVMNAILKLQGSKGISLVNLKKYLRDEKNLDVDKYNEEIKLALKVGLDRDMLIRTDGMYKVKGGDKGAKALDGRGKTSLKSSEREKAGKKCAPSGASRKKASEAKRGGDKGAKRLDGRGKTSQKSSESEKAGRKCAPAGASRKKASDAKRGGDKGAKRLDGRGKTSEKSSESEKAGRKRSTTGASLKKAPAKCDCVMCS